MDQALYDAILERRSVRRYDTHPLSESTLNRIQDLTGSVAPLVPSNRYTVLVRDVTSVDDLVQALGAYGRLLSPPHFMVPYIIGDDRPLLDLAYRTQQLVIRMGLLDLGCCYIGSLDRETTLRARFILRRDARIGAIVIFGRPSASLGGRTLNATLRRALNSAQRNPIEALFFNRAFDKPAKPPETIAPIIEAARWAPSALNVQPWRFLWRKRTLYLFVLRTHTRYGKGVKQEYRYFDAGLCMANVKLALEALQSPGEWVLLDGSERELPQYPDDLEPLARLDL
ncbi:MAG: nitroreductase family protein [Anaerolineae bacterium]|nr:nitroreductase family protein [Anaerolineae bacterium]